MTTGFLGTRPLLPVLSAVGEQDLAVQHFQSRKFPSWGYEVEQGATTIWERWNSYTKDKGFGGAQNAEMNSFSHYSFGAVCEWMFSQLAGIQSDGRATSASSFGPPCPRRTAIRSASRSIGCGRTTIPSTAASPARGSWKPGGFSLDVTIPANTTATVYMPARDAASITEGGKPLAQVQGVKLLRMEGDRAVLAVDSGNYQFGASFGQ